MDAATTTQIHALERLVTDVWARRADAWQVVARHGTGPLAR